MDTEKIRKKYIRNVKRSCLVKLLFRYTVCSWKYVPTIDFHRDDLVSKLGSLQYNVLYWLFDVNSLVPKGHKNHLQRTSDSAFAVVVVSNCRYSCQAATETWWKSTLIALLVTVADWTYNLGLYSHIRSVMGNLAVDGSVSSQLRWGKALQGQFTNRAFRVVFNKWEARKTRRSIHTSLGAK